MRALLTAAAAFLLFAGTAYAQTDGGATEPAPQAGATEIGEVDPGDPFGDIDTAAVVGVEEPDIAAFAATLGEAQVMELKERCDVISGDQPTYGDEAARLCDSFLKWWGESR